MPSTVMSPRSARDVHRQRVLIGVASEPAGGMVARLERELDQLYRKRERLLRARATSDQLELEVDSILGRLETTANVERVLTTSVA